MGLGGCVDSLWEVGWHGMYTQSSPITILNQLSSEISTVQLRNPQTDNYSKFFPNTVTNYPKINTIFDSRMQRGSRYHRRPVHPKKTAWFLSGLGRKWWSQN